MVLRVKIGLGLGCLEARCGWGMLGWGGDPTYPRGSMDLNAQDEDPRVLFRAARRTVTADGRRVTASYGDGNTRRRTVCNLSLRRRYGRWIIRLKTAVYGLTVNITV